MIRTVVAVMMTIYQRFLFSSTISIVMLVVSITLFTYSLWRCDAEWHTCSIHNFANDHEIVLVAVNVSRDEDHSFKTSRELVSGRKVILTAVT